MTHQTKHYQILADGRPVLPQFRTWTALRIALADLRRMFPRHKYRVIVA